MYKKVENFRAKLTKGNKSEQKLIEERKKLMKERQNLIKQQQKFDRNKKNW